MIKDIKMDINKEEIEKYFKEIFGGNPSFAKRYE